jgi:alpha-tubulin suppressor-like RCC1 family protein
MKKIIFLLLIFTKTPLFSQCFNNIYCVDNQTITTKADGSIWGWGSNDANRLNLGPNVITADTPQLLPFSAGWQNSKIVISNTSSYFIKTDGTLWGTGINSDGQLGLGFTSNYENLTQIGTSTWKDISQNGVITAGIKTDGTLWSWGANHYGEVGDGTYINRNSPVQISTATNWRSVSRGVCVLAINNNNQMYRYGLNLTYLLGDGSTPNQVTTPTLRFPSSDWKTVSVGSTAHALALKTDNTLWAWGANNYGQCGLGTIPVIFSAPLQVGTATWLQVKAGFNRSYGIQSNGTLWVWGLNDLGQLGLGHTNNVLTPTQIGTATNWVKVECGYLHTVAQKQDGSTWIWSADNYYGQLGNGQSGLEGPENVNTTPTAMSITGCNLSNESFEKVTVVIAPNPVKDFLNLAIQSQVAPTHFVIYDMQGKEILKTETMAAKNQQAQINLSHLAPATYFLTLYQENKALGSYKIVKIAD